MKNPSLFDPQLLCVGAWVRSPLLSDHRACAQNLTPKKVGTKVMSFLTLDLIFPFCDSKVPLDTPGGLCGVAGDRFGASRAPAGEFQDGPLAPSWYIQSLPWHPHGIPVRPSLLQSASLRVPMCPCPPPWHAQSIPVEFHGALRCLCLPLCHSHGTSV